MDAEGVMQDMRLEAENTQIVRQSFENLERQLEESHVALKAENRARVLTEEYHAKLESELRESQVKLREVSLDKRSIKAKTLNTLLGTRGTRTHGRRVLAHGSAHQGENGDAGSVQET